MFEFISDHENYIRWYPGVMAVTSADDLPPGTVGKVYNEILRLPSGRRRSFDIRVVESRAPDLFATEEHRTDPPAYGNAADGEVGE